MRTRATIAALSGALAIAALATPAAHASDTQGDATIKSVSVNGGKPIVVGTTKDVYVPVTLTVTDTDADAIDKNSVFVNAYHGSLNSPDGFFSTDFSSCVKGAASTYTCKGTMDATTAFIVNNDAAGTWQVEVWADNTEKSKFTTVKVQRYDKIAASNASPEPIKKGKTLTVTSKLTRASWEDYEYHGYAQTAELQFKKKGTSTYKDASSGSLKTTTKASYDGYWRYAFKGSSTSPAVSATSDYVDVK
jgi:hypothetical protein